MKCKHIKVKFPDFLIGEWEDISKKEIQEHMSTCISCREELESLSEIWTKLGVLPQEQPSDSLRSRFYGMLDAYKQGLEQEKVKPRVHKLRGGWLTHWWPRQPVFQVTFSLALLLVGLTAGYLLNLNGKKVYEVASLRQEVQGMRQTLAVSLLEQSSPTERLRGVGLSYRMEKPNKKIIQSLLDILNNDSNVNVRLAAVDALYLFHENPTVKEGLIQSLSRQTSPLIQVSLIDLMVNMRERRSIESLKQLIQDEKLNPDVKNHAEQGIQLLTY